LIGIVEASGTVSFLGTPVEIGSEFVATATRGRSPGLRFRFANGCAEGGCANWTGDGCGIAAAIVQGANAAPILPHCGIRQQCRWYRDRGGRACAVCSHVMRGCEQTVASREERGTMPPAK
jgi:hypothetical protein